MIIKIENSIEWKEQYPIFLSETYLKTESSEYGWIVGYVDGRREVFLPYFIYTELVFRLLRFTHAPYFVSSTIKEQYEQHFMDNLIDKVKTLNVDLIMQPTTNVVFDKVPKRSISAPFGSYKIDLTQEEEVLWKKLHSKHRNVIRNAEKKGVVISEKCNDIDTVYWLIHDTFSRSSMGFMSLEKFRMQIENLGDNVKIFIARTADGEVQGCAVIPYSQYGAYYLHGGSVARPLTGALNYLQWKVMLNLKALSVQKYDFVGARINVQKGTKLEGIQKFKERFGATLYEGYMWKYPIRPFKAKLFDTLYRLVKKPEGDIIDQERKKLL